MSQALIKLLTLGSFIGGPLFCTTIFTREWGLTKNEAFVASFAPLMLMLFAGVAMTEDKPSGFTRLLCWLGLGGAAALGAMNTLAVVRLAGGARAELGWMLWAGIAVGFVAMGLYGKVAREFLKPPPAT